MSQTGLDVFDSTVQQTNVWLNAISEELGWNDRRVAYEALRSTLHALRDHLTVEEGADLSAQLPMLIRGIYYEGWNPAKVPVRTRQRDDFLDYIRRGFARSVHVDPERMASAVLRVVASKISPGEGEDIRRMLPKAVRDLWPGEHSQAERTTSRTTSQPTVRNGGTDVQISEPSA